ncbi:MAG: DUF3828 domain-containing protein [Anaerolineales bacterium]|jgi:hypothetical protein
MKNKNQFAFLIILVAAGFSTLAFVIWPTVNATNDQATSQPDQVVQDFYTSYLSYDGNPLVDHVYRSSEFLSPDMIIFLDDFIHNGMDYDPLLCAQDKPTEINTSLAQVSGDQASVEISTNFENHAFSIELVQTNGDWLIDKVICTR